MWASDFYHSLFVIMVMYLFLSYLYNTRVKKSANWDLIFITQYFAILSDEN